MSERLRWKVADLLVRLPRTCWADLVSWALGQSPLRESLSGGRHCQREAAGHRDGMCYCGKFRTAAAQREYCMGVGKGSVVVPPAAHTERTQP